MLRLLFLERFVLFLLLWSESELELSDELEEEELLDELVEEERDERRLGEGER